MSSEPRVLIVESNDALRVLLFTILRYQPLAVDTAVSADEALQKTLGCDYALILVDVDVAGADMFIGSFREQRAGTNSFVIAVRDPNSNTYLDPELVDAVLNKPLEIDLLAELVRECALVVPAPEDPLNCPPAESEIRARLERGSYFTN